MLTFLAGASLALPPARRLSFGAFDPGPVGYAQLAPKREPIRKLGILNLDGYYYPTQPGDVNDLRTWCRVNASTVDDRNYTCELPLNASEFGATYAVIGDRDAVGPSSFTFYVSQSPEHFSESEIKGNAEIPTAIGVPLKRALWYLLNDSAVKAITCNVGFCAELQPLAQKAMAEILEEDPDLPLKPLLLGSPALMPVFTDALRAPDSDPSLHLRDNEKILIISSYYPGLSPSNLDAILKEVDPDARGSTTYEEARLEIERVTGLQAPPKHGRAAITAYRQLRNLFADDEALMYVINRTVVIGWNRQAGYIPVDQGGGFHNVKLTLDSYANLVNDTIKNQTAKGFQIKACRLAIAWPHWHGLPCASA